MTDDTTMQKQSNGNNSRVAVLCLSLVAGMGGLAYASVPLYEMFCSVTGYGGTTQAAENNNGIQILDRDVKVRFDANITNSLDWEFEAVQRDVTVKLGEQVQIAYLAKNLSDEPLAGTATFNVTPQSAGAYFNKIECFCFTQTTLQPGEELEMPVVFFVDPEMVNERETKDIHTITLSYTFFPKELPATPVAGLKSPKDGDVESKL